jgi:hypothetical protein
MNTAKASFVRDDNVRSDHPGADLGAFDGDGERIKGPRLRDLEILRQIRAVRAHGANVPAFEETSHGST